MNATKPPANVHQSFLDAEVILPVGWLGMVEPGFSGGYASPAAPSLTSLEARAT